MRPIRWIHISDIHLSTRNEWSQDVVLNAMCGNIDKLRAEGITADFILVTGDIAFSGKSDEYELAANFFDNLQVASGVQKKLIFCVPGNHDIDRHRQMLCFQGGRSVLRESSHVDSLLEGGEDLDTLLAREENYRQFQQSYFAVQKRTKTSDGLGYVSGLEINEIQMAIVGLDSAWLAEGGTDDHGKLLIGERQAIDAINLAQRENGPPNIIVGMAHHPLYLLQDFDRYPVQNQIQEVFHFFHCGHLHEHEAHIGGLKGSGCLTLVAGASFLSRQFYNAYHIVEVDLIHAVRNVKSFQYNPTNRTFSLSSSKDYQIEVTARSTCGVGELAMAMQAYCSVTASWAYYLSALVLGQKAEFPIQSENGYAFGSLDLLRTLSDSDLKQKTIEFMTFKNILHVLYNRKSLSEILVRHGDLITKYGEALTVACENDSPLRERLENHDEDCWSLADSETRESSSHTLRLLDNLVAEQDLPMLREQAMRHMDSSDSTVASKAKRMFAAILANSDQPRGKEKAIKYYQALVESEMVYFTDIGNMAILFMEVGNMDGASFAILEGIKKFPNKTSYFSEIGQKIVGVTGNRELRQRIEAATRG